MTREITPEEYKKMIAKKSNNTYSRIRRGVAKDLGNKYFRCAWERNYARYLEWQKKNGYILKWEYEPVKFEFKTIRSGTVFYTPDFKVFKNNGKTEYHEIKGYMDRKSATKIKRFRKYYPNETLIVVEGDQLKEIARFKNMIPFWEEGE